MKLKTLLLVAMATAAVAGSAQSALPVDPAVRTGRLDNGLTYYVRPNNYPEHHVDFFIAQRVGSIQEKESQRGLAHFLEHMCFNGTRHFPGNSLISYLESVGVKFGANLNAYTSTDETVYNICNVPSERRSVLDSCFLILADWSHDLSLKGKDIDAERGVIEGEWRHRTGANYRLLEKALPELYPGCPYGQRMPIGLMSVVKNFKHKELRDYYKTWYHPSNQCIIVVGDIEPDYAVERINTLFGPVKNPKHAAEVVAVNVPDNEEIIATVQTDREQTVTSVRLLYKHEDLPAELTGTTAYLRHDYLKSVVAAMMRERFNDLTRLADAPFTQVAVGDRDYMISKTRQAFQLIATARDGRADTAMTWLAREVRRALQYGFTEGEYRRARLNFESAVDKLYRERDQYSNTRYARDFVRAYLDGEPIPSISDYRQAMLEIIAGVTLDEVNAFLGTLVNDGHRNVALITFAPDSEQGNLPSRDDLIAAYDAGRTMPVEAPVDTPETGRLLTDDPTPGTIINERPLPLYGATVWTLSNGVKVFVKPTNLKLGEVIIAGAGPGGLSMNYEAGNAPSLKVINAVMALSGYGQFTSSDLKKALAGKDVKMRTFVSKTEEGFQGAAARHDLGTAFELLYLKLTTPNKDTSAFNTFIEAQRQRLANQDADPKFEFADSIFANVFAHHPLSAEKLLRGEVERVDYDRVLDCYHDRFADVSDLNVFVVGDFDTDTLRTLVCRYVASLPGHGRVEHPRDIGYHLFTGRPDVRWSRAMTTPQDKVYYFWTDTCTYDPRRSLLAKVTGQVLSAIFLKEIREDRGLTYHVDTHCSVVTDQNGDDRPVIFMPLNVTVTAGKADETRRVIDDIVSRVAREGIAAEQLDKVKKYLRKVQGEDVVDNSYWMVMMKQWAKYGMDFHTDYLTLLDSITPADVQRFVADHLVGRDRLTLTMTAR